jgi:hypothetical protein
MMKSLLLLLSILTSMALIDASHLTRVPANVSYRTEDDSARRTLDCFDHGDECNGVRLE